MQIGVANVEISMEIPQNTKNGSAFSPTNSTSVNISKETSNTNLKEYMHPYVCGGIIYNSLDWKVAQGPISGWVDKKAVVQFTQWNTTRPQEKKEILSFVTAQMDLESIMLSELSQSEKDI